MKVYLINPEFPLSLWDFSLCKDIDGSRFPFPPLGLATIAALTPKEHEIVICDENVTPAGANIDADIVGITGYYIQKSRAFQLADEFRKRGVFVALGGPLVQRSNIDECASHSDAVFIGEAEYTWPAFLNDFSSGRPRRVYAPEGFIDMADSPLPRFDLLDLRAYSTAIIETSRGCPHSCEFCEVPVRLGKGSRRKSTKQVMSEINALYSLGADSIFIVDDNFFGNRSAAVEIIKEIQKFVDSTGRGMYFSCQFTIDIARDSEILDLLGRANFRRVFIGIETPRRTSLLSAQKRQNTTVDLLESVAAIQSRNIIVWGAFMVGFDNDDASVFDEQFQFIQTASIPVAMVGILQAIPGTPLYDRVRSEGRLFDDLAAGIRLDAAGLAQTNIKPLLLSNEGLSSGFGRLVRKLYEHENFGERLINAIKAGKNRQIPSVARTGKKEILTLLRLLMHYLVTTDIRRILMFLKVVSQTVYHNPRGLHAALMHLVVYKHLREFYERGTN